MPSEGGWFASHSNIEHSCTLTVKPIGRNIAMGDFKQLPPITAGALSTATLMYPVDLLRALKMSAAAEGRGGTAVTLVKDFYAVRKSHPYSRHTRPSRAVVLMFISRGMGEAAEKMRRWQRMGSTTLVSYLIKCSVSSWLADGLKGFATQGVHVHGAVALPRFEPAETQLSDAR